MAEKCILLMASELESSLSYKIVEINFSDVSKSLQDCYKLLNCSCIEYCPAVLFSNVNTINQSLAMVIDGEGAIKDNAIPNVLASAIYTGIIMGNALIVSPDISTGETHGLSDATIRVLTTLLDRCIERITQKQ